jgi:hypothetical protein
LIMARIPSRRTLLGGAVALLGSVAVAPSGTAATTASPDANLITMCDEFVALEAKSRALIEADPLGTSQTNAAVAPFEDRQEELAGMIYDARATTIEGHRARALALLAWAPDLGDRDEWQDGPVGDNLRASLLRDLAGTPAGTGAVA